MAFSASDAAFEGFRLARRAPLAILAWTLVYVLMTVAVVALAGGSFAAFMETAGALENGGEPRPEDLAAIGMAYLGLMVVLFPVSLLFSAVLYAAVNRAVVRPAEKGFGYLRLGGDELRVLVVYLVLTIVFMLLAVLLFGVVGVIAGVLAATTSEGWAVLAGVIGGLAALCLFIWIMVRLSLALPMTVAEKRIAIFDSWSVTRGRFWGLLGMAVLAFILTLVVSAILWTLFTIVLLIMGGSLAQLEGAALEGAELSELIGVLGPVAVVGVVFLGLMSALELTILYAPFARAYRDLKGGGGEPVLTTPAPAPEPEPQPAPEPPAADPAP